MSDGEIEVDLGTGGIYVDTSTVGTGEGTVNRQRVAIGDASAAENFLAIGSDGAASVHVLNQSSGGTSASVSILNPVASVTAIPYGVQSVAQSGSWSASVQGATGRTWDLNSTTDSVTAIQGTTPWAASVEGQVGVTQVTSPWVVSGNVTSSGSVSAVQAGQWSINQGTPPWTVAGSVTSIQGGPPWYVIASGSVAVTNPTTNVSASVNLTVASVTVASVSVLNWQPLTMVAGSVSILNPSGSSSNVNVTNAYLPVTQQGNWGASISNTVPVSQSGAPWSVDAIQQGNWGASISNVVPVSQSGAWSASVDGTVVATQGGAWTVAATQQGNYGASISNFPVSQAVTQGTVPWAASVEGQVGVTQITSPWVISGNVTAQQGGNYGASISNFPAVQPVSQQGNWGASITNQPTVLQGNAPWTVNASQSGNWGASVTQGTSPWVTSGTSTVSGSVSAIQTGTWYTTVSGSVTAIPYGNQTISGSVSVLNPSGGSGAASVSILNSALLPVADAASEASLAIMGIPNINKGKCAGGTLVAGAAGVTITFQGNDTFTANELVIANLTGAAPVAYTLDGTTASLGGNIGAAASVTNGQQLSALSTLTFTASTSLWGTSGIGTIVASGGTHTFAWTGQSGSTLTGCTYSAPTTDTVATNAVITQLANAQGCVPSIGADIIPCNTITPTVSLASAGVPQYLVIVRGA